MNHTWHWLLLLGVTPFLASCASIVDIQSPRAGCSVDAQPVNELRVKFHQRFQPGTFTAVLKRRDPGVVTPLSDVVITQSFTPAPAPGGTSTATGLSFDPHAYALRVVGDSSPGQAFDSLSDELEFQAPRLSLSKPGVTPTGGNCVSHPLGLSGSDNLRINRSATFEVWIPRTLTSQNSLTVSLSPNNRNVALQGLGPGDSTTVTWNAGSQANTSFTVTGRNLGAFVITVSAPGYQTTTLHGTVVP